MEYLEIINNYGFPIFCVVMMGMFIYNSYNKVMEENPKTSDINLALIIGTIALASVGTIISLKKRNSKVNG